MVRRSPLTIEMKKQLNFCASHRQSSPLTAVTQVSGKALEHQRVAAAIGRRGKGGGGAQQLWESAALKLLLAVEEQEVSRHRSASAAAFDCTALHVLCK